MILYLVLTFILSFIFTWVLRLYALKREVLDVPNGRSAHTLPTPRGGGLAFVIAALLVLPSIEYAGFLTENGSAALVSAGVFIAILGFLDDHTDVSSFVRLMGHFLAAVSALFWVGGMPPIHFGSFVIPSSIILDIVVVLYLVWLTNLYNFMDGINGLAGAEAFCVCVGMALIYYCMDERGLMVVPMTLAASVAGFICWNFPRAKIFMGDAGSGFLGFIFGVLSIQAALVNLNLFWAWVILLGVFIVDATYTLLCRLLRFEKVYQAHSMHAFQHAARRFNSHEPVTIGVALINVFWLFPIAYFVSIESISVVYAICIAYAPLVGLELFFKAGRPS